MSAKQTKAIVSWTLTIGCGVGLGLVAAQFRLLDNPIVVAVLIAVVVLLIGVGLWGMLQPWDEWDE